MSDTKASPKADILESDEWQKAVDYEIADIAMLVEAAEAKPGKRGPHRTRFHQDLVAP